MARLVPFAPEHFDVLSNWFASEADVVQWGGPLLSFPLTVEQLRPMLTEAETMPPTRLCWMTEHDGILVGHAQLGFDWRNGNALLSRVAVAPHARGRGLAGPMLRLVLGQALARPEIMRVELNVYAWNVPAIRSYKRLGFKIEGVRRSSALVNGERWDTAIMALLRQEWRPRSDQAWTIASSASHDLLANEPTTGISRGRSR
ncbi:GNAT family N-acetyltransferase [uncultured Sphingomonas sp.]|uniref:GNAT family N-acetyltransferase n=1 Tax=uncultured Sphingomonas sp. TaxID=158754 RepID=UPI0037497A72